MSAENSAAAESHPGEPAAGDSGIPAPVERMRSSTRIDGSDTFIADPGALESARDAAERSGDHTLVESSSSGSGATLSGQAGPSRTVEIPADHPDTHPDDPDVTPADGVDPTPMGLARPETTVGETDVGSGTEFEVTQPSETRGRRTTRDPLLGQVFVDRYRLLDRLGAGGMGTVYLAEHIAIQKRVAIKVLAGKLAKRDDLRKRFLREARATSAIKQQNVIDITDFGDTPDGSVFFAMEYCEGEDLSDTISREGALPWHRAQHILLQICAALTAAHGAGIVHRDMKPDNCFRTKQGDDPDFIKVLDFGIAKMTGVDQTGLTQTGMVFGTPDFMSPEQARGEKVDHRTDLYAFGIIMFEVLTGKRPFKGDRFMGVLKKHMFEPAPAPSSVLPADALPKGVDEIVMKALAKDRDNRFQSAAEMAEAIRGVAAGAAPVVVAKEKLVDPSLGEVNPEPAEPARGRKIPWLGIVLGAAALGGGAFIGLQTMKQKRKGKQADPVEQPAAAPAEAPVAAPPQTAEPEPKPPEVPPGPPLVTVVIETVVPGKVLDEADGGYYGMTNDSHGIELKMSNEEVLLRIEAEGYEPAVVKIIPNMDGKVYRPILDKARRRRGGKKRKPKVQSPQPVDEPDTPTPLPEVEPEKPKKKLPAPPPDDGREPIKDPFAGKGVP